eukprot:m51a1_g1679 putative er membrane protein complex subunit 2 (266) ;mRNA; r:426119-427206
MRRAGARRSDLVVKYGEAVLRTMPSSEPETWLIHEQVIMAALDLGDVALAENYTAAVARKFPGSATAKRLQGMCYEAAGNFPAAEALYAAVLKSDPANTMVMKRQVAVIRASGAVNTAVNQLNTYLAMCPADAEAWLELADLYTSSQSLRNAAFCLEEALLASPESHALWSRAAEVAHTLGDYTLARKYFARAAELTEAADAKSLLGVCLSCSALARSGIAGQRAARENSDLFEWAAARLAAVYARAGSSALLSLAMIDRLRSAL